MSNGWSVQTIDEASEKCLVCAKRIGGDLDTKSSLATTQHKDTKSFCVSDGDVKSLRFVELTGVARSKQQNTFIGNDNANQSTETTESERDK
jgi:hypothetical protein